VPDFLSFDASVSSQALSTDELWPNRSCLWCLKACHICRQFLFMSH